ncbi:hypothetical protein OH492_24180 [Vibrio chagasii]|nr:hypothetical protein [Vibrio chagasii]
MSVGKKTSDKELAIDWVIETQTEDVSKPILGWLLNGNLFTILVTNRAS